MPIRKYNPRRHIGARLATFRAIRKSPTAADRELHRSWAHNKGEVTSWWRGGGPNALSILASSATRKLAQWRRSSTTRRRAHSAGQYADVRPNLQWWPEVGDTNNLTTTSLLRATPCR